MLSEHLNAYRSLRTTQHAKHNSMPHSPLHSLTPELAITLNEKKKHMKMKPLSILNSITAKSLRDCKSLLNPGVFSQRAKGEPHRIEPLPTKQLPLHLKKKNHTEWSLSLPSSSSCISKKKHTESSHSLPSNSSCISKKGQNFGAMTLGRATARKGRKGTYLGREGL